ncbi:hypothetical protein BDV25DRAFT_86308 [Aspergillus avenaceus]|uniref:Uncharacterized protein n=1 Tax=Aspergillus avenaceus TaxID=36643 RepID=A0A5N6TEK0_ASPAV|nr:hypothetical protein BDV25DRAFT_86308 [Aspergillus avenaceus]
MSVIKGVSVSFTVLLFFFLFLLFGSKHLQGSLTGSFLFFSFLFFSFCFFVFYKASVCMATCTFSFNLLI